MKKFGRGSVMASLQNYPITHLEKHKETTE